MVKQPIAQFLGLALPIICLLVILTHDFIRRPEESRDKWVIGIICLIGWMLWYSAVKR